MKRKKITRLLVTATFMTGTMLTSAAHAFDLRQHFEEMQTLPRSFKNFEFHELNGAVQRNTRAFQLLQTGQLSLDDAVKSLVRGTHVHPRLQLKIKGSKTGFSLNSSTSEAKDVRFAIGDVDICRFQLRAHRLSDGSLFMLGRIPEIGTHEVIPSGEGAYLEDVLDVVRRHMDDADLGLLKAKKCLHVSGGSLMPVWDLTVRSRSLPYRVLADGYEVIDIEDGYFTIEGTAVVHAQNQEDGNVVELKLNDLKGDGTLTSSYLRALARDENSDHVQTAIAKDHVFDFPVTDSRYDEVAAYSYAQIHHDFFKGIGFVWYGPKPMEIKVHEQPGGQTNNALFIPADSAGEDLPTIFVGDGDGSILKNLPRDGDVISHEFGHHVIYQSLKSTKGESLVLHEGLADFFAFSRTGDACLGEAICPKNSSACWVPSTCLRTADNNMKYEDQTFNAVQGHLQGQVISGLLWDLRKSNAMPPEDVTRLVYKSVSFLEEESGFRHFFLALFNADKELFSSKYLEKIKEAAVSRGFEEMVADIEPGADIPLPEDEPSSLTPDIPPTTPKKKEKTESESGDNFMQCAVVPGAPNPHAGLLMILLLAVPVFFAARPSYAKAPKRRRR